MNKSIPSFRYTVAGCLTALSVFVCLPSAVLADQNGQLQAETAAMDAPLTIKKKVEIAKGMLSQAMEDLQAMNNGQLAATVGAEPAQNAGTSVDGAAASTQLQPPANASAEASQKFQLSATKLASGAKMTQEDFRDLGIGTLGLSADQQSNEEYPRVTNVFAGSPAEEAGIRVGDLVLSNDSLPNEAPGSWNQEEWKFHFDHVGTQSAITIKRGRKVMAYTLTRMNIEDLPDPKIRRVYEEQALKLGLSGQGTIETTKRPHRLP